MAEQPDVREKATKWVRWLVKEYPSFACEDEETGAPEPNIKMIDRAISKLKAEDDTLKSLSDSDAIQKIINAPRIYNERINRAEHGKSLCETIREDQRNRGLY